MTSDAILVVDDDSHVLSSFRRQLGDRFNLTTVQSGNEAIDRVQRACEAKKPFAVVICDMRMPGIDGVETLEEIRTVSPNTVRLMLTGNADQQTAIDAINRGQIFRFYTKPFPLDQLGEAEQIRISTAIAMATNPKLRVIRIMHGEALDEDSLAVIAKMAEENDFQVWMAKVDSTGKVGIFLEDGQIKAEGEE